MKKYIFFLILIIFFGVLIFSDQPVLAYVASSTHYQMEKDSINFGGADFSTSSSFILSDTFGESATGASVDLAKIVQAGYRAAENNYLISISSTGGVNLSPQINGVSGGSSTGSTTWQVTTNNPNGYELYLKSATNPSLKAGNNYFDDYVTSVSGTPDFAWQIDPSSAMFGFSVDGVNVVQKFKNDGVSCGVGLLNSSSTCWTSLDTTYQLVASSSLPNYPAKTDLTANFKAEVGTNKVLNAGDYSVQVTAMAMVL